MANLAQKYGNALGAMANTATKVGRALPPKKTALPTQPRPAAFDTNKYAKLSGNLKRGNQVGGVGTVTVPYGGQTKYENVHGGIDIGNKLNTPLYSTTQGKVTKVVSGKKQGDKDFGNYVEVQDAQGNRHRYSHLTKSYVKIGDSVNKGQLYGTMGNSGSAYSTTGGTGSHLDYRIWDMYNKYVNPEKYLTI